MTRIYAIVRKIPRGSVATYGEVAALAGIESGHRVAAHAMRVCPESLPWQRVLGKKDARRGQINIGEPDHKALQRALLEAEGVAFDDNGFVPLREHGWLWQTGSASVPKQGSPPGAKRTRKKATSSHEPAPRKRRA